MAKPPETHAPSIAAQPAQPSHVDFTELQAEIAVEVDIVLAHLKTLAELERRIGALYTELQPDNVLRTIPGVGQHLAPVLLGLLHTAERFHSERHIRGFCGLFPRRADSGGAEKPGQTITQGGPTQGGPTQGDRDRIFSVLRRGKPYVLRDRDGHEITTAEAKALVAEQFTVPEAIRASRRANRAAIAA